jgi:predicted nucleic acid-binding protein
MRSQEESLLTYYEVLRGLKAIKDFKKLQEFEDLISSTEVIPLTEEVMKRALVLITDNGKHFKRIKGLQVGNWLREEKVQT